MLSFNGNITLTKTILLSIAKYGALLKEHMPLFNTSLIKFIVVFLLHYNSIESLLFPTQT